MRKLFRCSYLRAAKSATYPMPSFELRQSLFIAGYQYAMSKARIWRKKK